MADKNNKEFKWNFNLDDADSDFTDIDFTNSEYEKSDKDIQPIIFVRDETAKKKTTTEKKPAEEAVQRPAARRTSAAAKKPAAKRPAAKKKKRSGFELNWKLIALIAAAVLVVALIVVLLTKCGKKEEKAWTPVEPESKVKVLMDKYFAAKTEGVADDMRKVLVTDAVVNASIMAVESNIYSGYTNINLQQYPGINKNEAVICATYDTGLKLLEGTSVPTIGWFYALPDASDELRLMTTTEMKLDAYKDTIKKYVEAAAALLEKTTVAEVQTRYNNAVNSNSLLAQYLQNIKDGNYYTRPTESASGEAPASTPASTEDVPAPSTEDTPATKSDPTPSANVTYINASSLRMRTGSSTDSEVITNLPRGYCVTVIGEEGDWLKIRDDVQTNPATGTSQSCSFKEGFVSKSYTVNEYSKISWN